MSALRCMPRDVFTGDIDDHGQHWYGHVNRNGSVVIKTLGAMWACARWDDESWGIVDWPTAAPEWLREDLEEMAMVMFHAGAERQVRA